MPLRHSLERKLATKHTVAIGVLFALLLTIPLGSLRQLYAASPPAITSVSPAQGPALGGTQVSIATSDIPAATPVDVASTAQGGTASANNSYSTNTPGLAFDGSDTTNWTGPGGTGYYVQSTFNKAYSIQQVSWNKCGSDTTPRQARIQLLQNGVWVDAVTFADATTANTGQQTLANAVTATAVRMYFSSAGGWVVCSSLSAYRAGYDISFGGTAATNVSFPDATHIQATTPTHAAGTVNVVIASNGTTIATLANGYEYLPPPTATAASPSTGYTTGGDAITISGTNFMPGTTVRFGSTAAVSVSYVNATTLTAISPTAIPGTVSIIITNPDGQTATLSNAYTYENPPPNVQSISPSKGTQNGGTAVTVTGSNFIPPNTLSNTWTASSKTLPAAFGRATTAVVGNTIYLYGGLSGGSFLNTIYSAPVSDPTTWTNTGKTLPATRSDSSLIISGNTLYMFGGDGAGGGAIYSAPVSDPTTWTNTGKSLPTNNRLAQVAVIGSTVYLFGGYNTSAGAASSVIYSAPVSDPTTWTNTGKTLPSTVFAASLAVINNTIYLFGGNGSTAIYSAPVSDPTTWTNTGKSLPVALSDTAITTIGDRIYLFGGTSIYSAPVSSPTTWTNTGKSLPSAASASSIAVIDNSAYLFGGIGSSSILTSAISHYRPNQYNKSWLTNWSTNTTDQSAVLFGGTPATSVSITSTNQLTATSPAHSGGPTDVSIRNYDGKSASLTNGYIYTQPTTITAASPSQGVTTGGDVVTISGTNFTIDTTVSFGGTPSTAVTFINSTTITAKTPANTYGSVNILVSDSEFGPATLTNGFTYIKPAPSVNSYSPTAGPMAGGTTVIFQGSGFTSDMTATFGGVAANTTGYTTNTLTVTVPSNTPKDTTVILSAPNTYAYAVSPSYRFGPDAYTFTNSALQLRATQPGQLTIESRDKQGTPVTAPYDTDLQLTTTSGSGSFSTDGGNTWGATSVRLSAGQSTVSFMYRDAGKGTPTLRAIGVGSIAAQQTVTINSKYGLLVTGVSDPLNAGIPSSVTVQAVDYLGNPVSDYTGTVRFSSSDQYASLPGDFTITSGMQGRHTFTNGLSLTSDGEQCVGVADTSDAVISGQQCAISVSQGYNGAASNLHVITDQQGIAANKASGAITVQSQDTDGNPAPLPVDTTIYITSNSGTANFSKDGASNWTSTQNYIATIKAHATSTTIYYRDATNGTYTLGFKDQSGATDTKLIDTTQNIRIGTGPAAKLAIPAPSILPTNTWKQIDVQLHDQDDQTTTNTSDPLPIYLTSSSNYVLFSATSSGTAAAPSISGSVPTGGNHVRVYVKSTAVGGAQLIASDASPADGSSGLTDSITQVEFAYISPSPNQLTITGNASAVAGQPTVLHITARDSDGNLAASNQIQSISLGSTPSGEYSLSSNNWSPVNSVTLPANATSVDVYYKTNEAGTSSLQAGASFGASNAFSIDVTSSSYAKLEFIAGPNDVAVTEPTLYTVGSRDMYGNSVAATSDTLVYLYQTNNDGSFAQSATSGWGATNTTISTGNDTASFYYKNATLHSTARITASDNSSYDNPDTGIVNASKDIRVIGQVAQQVQIISPAQTAVAGETSSEIKIQLQKNDGTPAVQDTDQILYLSSDSLGNYSFNTTAGSSTAVTQVTVPAGDSQVSVYYSDTKQGTHKIQAGSTTYGISTDQTIQINAATPEKLLFATPPQTNEINVPSAQIEISILDQYGNKSQPGNDTTIALSSNCSTGSYSVSSSTWSPITELVIPNGQSSGFVYFKTNEANCNLTASTNGLANSNQTYKTYGGPSKVMINGPTTLESGQTAQYTVFLQDVNGNTAIATKDTTFYVNSSNGTTGTQTVTIASGSSSATTTITASSTGVATLAVRDEQNLNDPDVGIANDSLSITVVQGQAVATTIHASTNNNTVNDSVAVTVQLVNKYGQPVVPTSDTAISLSSSAPGIFKTRSGDTNTISDTLIPSGSSSVTVYYTQSVPGSATLKGSSTDYTAGSTDIIFTNGALTSYRLTGPSTLEAGQTGIYTIEGRDTYGNTTAFIPGQRIYIYDTQVHGVISGGDYDPADHSLLITDSTSVVTFAYKNTATGTNTLTVSNEYPVSNSSNVTKATQAITITEGAPAAIVFESPEVTFERGGTSDPIDISLRNAYGIKTNATANTSIDLSSSKTSGTFASSNAGPWNLTKITITAGTSNAVAYYHDDTATGTFTIQASASRLATGTQTGEVLAGVPSTIAFTSAPQTVASTHPSSSITAALYNRFNLATKSVSSNTLRLLSSSNTGEFANQSMNWGISSTVWPADTAQLVFYYRDSTAGTPTISGQYGTLNTVNQPMTIIPQVVDHLYVTNISTPQVIGTSSSIVVIAQDAENYAVPAYTGTIRFTSTDQTADLPKQYTFNAATDKGLHTFINGVTFNAIGVHSVSAIDTISSVSGRQDNIIVNPTSATNPGPGPTTTPPQGTAAPQSPSSPSNPSTSSSSSSPTSPVQSKATYQAPRTTGPTVSQSPQANINKGENQDTLDTQHSTAEVLSGNAITKRLRTIARSPLTTYVVPGIVYLGLMLFTLFVAASMYREIKQARLLAALLKREKQTAADKTAFLGIASHHVRTPVTIIAGASELLASTAKDDPHTVQLQRLAEDLKRAANDIVQKVSVNTAINGEKNTLTTAMRAPYSNPFFWAPILAAIIITFAINIFVQQIGQQNPAVANYIYQAIAIFGITILLYLALRGQSMRRTRRIALQNALLHEEELDIAKNNYISLIKQRFDTAISELEILQAYFAKTATVMIRPLNSGIAQLKRLVETMDTLASVDSTTLHPQHFNLDKILSESITELQEQIDTKHIKVQLSAGSESVAFNHDHALMKRVLSSILSNAVEHSPEGAEIAIEATQDTDTVTFSVVDSAGGVPVEVTTKPLEPFMHDRAYSISEKQSLGLSLYLDSLIVRRFGGKLTINNEHKGARVTVKLPL